MATDIEWARNPDGTKGETWNPTTGCDRVSPGCDHCYALTMAARLKRMGQAKYQADGDPSTSGPGFALTVHPDTIPVPMRWKKPRTVFVNSMSDLFHKDVDHETIAEVWTTMALCPQHTFQILTKRPKRMAAYVPTKVDVEMRLTGHAPTIDWQCREYPVAQELGEAYWLPNVWLGTSIENDRYTFRADHLRATPAAVRFLSCEPLLGPLPSLNLDDIDWVIVGGESGPGARPMQPDWVRDIRDRCNEAGVSFFFKQWGAWLPYEPDPQPPFWAGQDGDLVDGHHLPADLSQGDPVAGWWAYDLEHEAIFRKVGKHAAGRRLDGRTWDELPTSTPERQP